MKRTRPSDLDTLINLEPLDLDALSRELDLTPETRATLVELIEAWEGPEMGGVVPKEAKQAPMLWTSICKLWDGLMMEKKGVARRLQFDDMDVEDGNGKEGGKKDERVKDDEVDVMEASRGVERLAVEDKADEKEVKAERRGREEARVAEDEAKQQPKGVVEERRNDSDGAKRAPHQESEIEPQTPNRQVSITSARPLRTSPITPEQQHNVSPKHASHIFDMSQDSHRLQVEMTSGRPLRTSPITSEQQHDITPEHASRILDRSQESYRRHFHAVVDERPSVNIKEYHQDHFEQPPEQHRRHFPPEEGHIRLSPELLRRFNTDGQPSPPIDSTRDLYCRNFQNAQVQWRRNASWHHHSHYEVPPVQHRRHMQAKQAIPTSPELLRRAHLEHPTFDSARELNRRNLHDEANNAKHPWQYHSHYEVSPEQHRRHMYADETAQTSSMQRRAFDMTRALWQRRVDASLQERQRRFPLRRFAPRQLSMPMSDARRTFNNARRQFQAKQDMSNAEDMEPPVTNDRKTFGKTVQEQAEETAARFEVDMDDGDVQMDKELGDVRRLMTFGRRLSLPMMRSNDAMPQRQRRCVTRRSEVDRRLVLGERRMSMPEQSVVPVGNRWEERRRRLVEIERKVRMSLRQARVGSVPRNVKLPRAKSSSGGSGMTSPTDIRSMPKWR